MNIKKCAAALLVSSVLLTGCSGSSSKSVKKDGKYVVASLTDKNLFADDIFDKIVSTANGKNSYFEAVLQKLMDKKCPINDAMKTDASTIVKQIEDSYSSQYGENADAEIEKAVSQAGYASLDDYEQSLIKALQYSEFLKLYIDANYDTIFEDYITQASPRMVSMVKVSMADVENPTDEEKAKLEEVTKLVASSKGFDEIAKDYSDDENSKKNGGKLGVVDTTSKLGNTYGADVETKALALSEGEVTSEAIKGTEGYYFLKCTSTDKEKIKNAIKDLGIDTPLLSYDDYLVYVVFNSYKITYKDDDVKQIVTDIVKDNLDKREKERAGEK